MSPQIKLTDQFRLLMRQAVRMSKDESVDAMLLLLDGPTDWEELRGLAGKHPVLIAVEKPEHGAGAAEFEFPVVVLKMGDASVQEQLGQALLEGVAADLLSTGARVLAVYSGYEAGSIDSLSFINLDEHLGRLTVRDLRRLETSVPLDTLRIVVDLAVEIGRDGREGKTVGTLFVVGDHRSVAKHCHPVGFDPVKGYNRRDRNLDDPKVREGVKEVAQLDGAFIVSADGTVEAGVQHVAAPADGITLSKGLGARHWAAAAISRATNAVAVSVSESNGTVRVFQNGEVMLRIEPFRRAMKWKDFGIRRRLSGRDSPAA